MCHFILSVIIANSDAVNLELTEPNVVGKNRQGLGN
jgi:hypothetical protein